MLWQNRCSINKSPLPRRKGVTHCKALIYKEGQHNFFRTHHGDGTGVCFCPIVAVYFSLFFYIYLPRINITVPRGLIRASRSFQDPSPHRKESEIGKSKLESLASGRKYRGGFRLGSKRKGRVSLLQFALPHQLLVITRLSEAGILEKGELGVKSNAIP